MLIFREAQTQILGAKQNKYAEFCYPFYDLIGMTKTFPNSLLPDVILKVVSSFGHRQTKKKLKFSNEAVSGDCQISTFRPSFTIN
jgi:hypothetical protein